MSYVDAYVAAPQEVSSDTVWSKDAGPYLITGSVLIPVGVTLSVGPGTVIMLQEASIMVQGVLNIGSSTAENVVFEIDQPGDNMSLALIIESGQMNMSNVQVRGNLSLRLNEGVVKMDTMFATSGDMIISSHAHATLDDVHIEHHDFTLVSNGSSLIVQNSSLHDGYINVDTQSSLNLEYSELFDIEKVRVLNQSVFNSSYLDMSGGGGFLIKNKSTATFNNSIVENIFTETAFALSAQSSLFFDGSYISPLLSDFALLVDKSVLCATSTDVTDILQRGIQAVRDSVVHLSDVTLTHTITETGSETFLTSLVGSTLFAEDSRFLNTSGNAIELYNSNTKPYSVITLRDSQIEDYGKSGIYAVQATGTIDRSIIRGGKKGIEHIFSYLTISHSHMSHNSEYGAVAYVPANVLLAENNFWGDSSGPRHLTLEPLGKGDTVSDNVLFSPWLSKDPTNPCCSSVMFFPGLMASRLYELDTDHTEKMLWEPLVVGGDSISHLFLNEFGKSLRGSIYTRDAIDETPFPLIGINIYKSFIQDMDDLKIAQDIYDWQLIPYDWRLSLYDVLNNGYKEGYKISYTQPVPSPYIFQEFERLARESKTGKVTLIAHSNGGLVAKLFMSKLSEMNLGALVDKIIFIAVPQVGTPQALGALLHGFGQGIPKDSFPLFASPELMRMFGFNMPGAYGLLPSTTYFDTVSDPVIVFATSSIATSSTLFSFLRGLNPYLLSYAQQLHQEIDEWIPPLYTEVIQIAGWGRDTVKGIRYYQSIKNRKPITQYNPLFTEDGDQTVVIPSALFLGTTTPNISRYWLNLKNINKGKIVKRSHADILETDPARDIIKRSIHGEPVLYTGTISTSSPGQSKDKRLQFLLHSEVARLDIYDDQGNHTGIATTTGSVEENVPDSLYGQFGEVIYVSTPAGGRKTLSVTAGAPNSSEYSYTLDVAEAEGDILATSTSFIDVPVMGTSTAVLDISGSIDSLTNLRVDSGADGTIDYYVEPGSVVSSLEHVADDIKVPVGNSHRKQREIVAHVSDNAANDTPTSTKKDGVVRLDQTASVVNALSHGKILSVGFFSSNLKHMTKILGIVIAIGVIGALVFMYFTRPASAPTQDINAVVSSKLPAGSATSSVYRISQEKSLVKFTMNEMLNGSPFLVVGTTTQVAGDIAVKDGKFQIGELAINAKTLVTDNAKRNGAIARLILKAETPGNEFITFKPTSNNFVGTLEAGKQVTFNLSGDLTISGVTKPVVFKVVTMVNEQQVVGTAEVTIKRSDFELKIPSLSFIANVDDAFPVTVSIVADRIMQ